MVTANPSASAAQPIVLHNLTLGYERHPAVHHLSATLEPGSMVALVGPNGAGKSTLLKALAGLLRPLDGHIHGLPPSPAAGRWGLARPQPKAPRLAYLPQQSEVDRSFPISVFDLVAFGLWHETGALRRLSPAQRQRVHTALATVGLTGFERRTLATLSGGQFQRALFARLALQDAAIVLLDEPFVGVDSRTVSDLMRLLLDWHAQGRTLLVVLHDLELVRAHFPLSWLLARELVAAGPTAAVLTEANLQRARSLNEAFDDQAPACGQSGPSVVLPLAAGRGTATPPAGACHPATDPSSYSPHVHRAR